MDFLDRLLSGNSGKTEPGDMADIVRWGAIGAVGFSGYQYMCKSSLRTADPAVSLIPKTSVIGSDEVLVDALVKLQVYRTLSTARFTSAVQTFDRLVHAERGIASGEILAMPDDKSVNFARLRVGMNKLNEMVRIVYNEMGLLHGKVALINLQIVHKQMEKHYMNIVHLVRKFNPDELLKQADEELNRTVVARPRAPASTKKWDELSRRCRSDRR